MKTYIVEYTPEGANVSSQIFVSANDEAAANDKVIDKFGPYTIINGTYLSKSYGGSGAPSPTDARIDVVDQLIETVINSGKTETTVKIIETETKTDLKVNTKTVVKKPTNASKIRGFIAENRGKLQTEYVAWAIEHCGMKRPVANSYVRAIMREFE